MMAPDPWALALAPAASAWFIATLKALRPGWLPRRGRRRQAALALAGVAGSSLVVFTSALVRGAELDAATVAQVAAEAVTLALASMGIYAQVRGHQAPPKA